MAVISETMKTFLEIVAHANGIPSFLTTELEELGVFYLIYDLCETETNSRGAIV